MQKECTPAKLKRGETRGGEARGRSGAFGKRRVKEAARRFDEGMEPKKGVDESSLDELFLYTTVCIVGFPVEVQVKDGSLYSGILHTACFEKDQGEILILLLPIEFGGFLYLVSITDPIG